MCTLTMLGALEVVRNFVPLTAPYYCQTYITLHYMHLSTNFGVLATLPDYPGKAW